MKSIITRCLLLMLCLLPLTLLAETKEEAKEMALKAKAFIEQNGLDAARTAFQDKNGEFIKGELYVYVQDINGTMLIHGVNPKLDNTNHINLRDPKGTYFVKEMISFAQSPAKEGWVEYLWKHPATGKLTPKVTYVRKIDNMDAYVGCGVFL